MTPTRLVSQPAQQDIQTQTISPPIVNPNPVSVHPMVTRFRVGSNRPPEHLNLHVSSISPLPNRYKARHVANGFTQLEGIDVDETFSLVVKLRTIQTIFSLATSRHRPVHQLDVKNAFLHGDLSKTVYMLQPLGFGDFVHLDYVCLLQRSLYGLKKAPKAWFQRFASYITRVGFHHSRCDSSLFIYRQGTYTAYLLLYVDDIVLTASSETLLQQVISSLHQEFSITDLGSLKYLLGISITRDSTGMFLSQRKYAIEILERAHMANYNLSQTLVDTESKLGDDGDLVCLYMHDHREPYFSALKRILRGRVSWCCNAVAETCWLRNLLRELYTPLSSATLVYCDNVSAVYLSSNPVQHQRMKHIVIDIHFVRDLVVADQIRILHVPSRYQYADIFTKRLSSALFEEFRTSLSVRCPPAPTVRECSPFKENPERLKEPYKYVYNVIT
ncbi:ribonuclease H-like domain-containing protein [Tanacetum coccineum]